MYAFLDHNNKTSVWSSIVTALKGKSDIFKNGIFSLKWCNAHGLEHVHHSDTFQFNLSLFMQQCKNELQFISAHMIHQRDNVLPDNCNISHLYLHSGTSKSKLEDNNGTVWAAESLWHVQTCRWERIGLNFWMQGLAWDAGFRKSSLLYKEMQGFEHCTLHLASLSMRVTF